MDKFEFKSRKAHIFITLLANKIKRKIIPVNQYNNPRLVKPYNNPRVVANEIKRKTKDYTLPIGVRSTDLNPAEYEILPLRHTDWLFEFWTNFADLLFSTYSPFPALFQQEIKYKKLFKNPISSC